VNDSKYLRREHWDTGACQQEKTTRHNDAQDGPEHWIGQGDDGGSKGGRATNRAKVPCLESLLGNSSWRLVRSARPQLQFQILFLLYLSVKVTVPGGC